MGKDNSLFLWMEDFDNAELSETDRREQLEEAVRVYNQKHSTNYQPKTAFMAYSRWLKEKDK